MESGGGRAGVGGRRVGLGRGVVGALVVSAFLAASARADLASPRVTTAASGSVPVGGQITDLAVLSGGVNPTGTITFDLYDVTDAKCAGKPVFTSTVPVGVPATSAAFTPTKAGTYTWIAGYSGDAANNKATGACADPGETVAVTALTPTVTTVASPSVALGGSVGDTAVVSGGYKPTGTVTFKLYGAADPGCAGSPVFTSTIGLATPTVSGAYAPTAPGTYHFVATYNGDAANTTASSGCADPTESVLVTPGAAKTPAPPGGPRCDAGAMARALVTSLVGTLTGAPSPFQAVCSAGVRIVLRAREIRPGNPGIPNRDGYTTIANTLTHGSPTTQIGFQFNAQGLALRSYATSHGLSLLVFAIAHVRPDRTTQSSEAVAIFNLR
ncbi:MAG: hypothetical protein LC720_04915 [Actinobacteria bacterium]|nr:hypothetical protein [Actinomycetota bacterium]